MKLDWEIIAIIILFVVIALAGASQAAPVIVERGAYFNRYYDSATGKYTLQAFGSPENVYEDGRWVQVSKAKSLKGIWQVKFLKSDANFPLQVLDLNFTHITINISSAVVGQIPFQWCRSTCSNADCSLSNVACSNLTVAVTAGTRNKFQSMSIPMTAIEFDNLTWGTSSTTIQITNGNVTDDAYVLGPDGTNYAVTTIGLLNNLRIGNVTAGSNYEEVDYLKFNISAIPAGVTINDAQLGMMMIYNMVGGTADGQGIGVHHVYNSSVFTIDGLEWNECPSCVNTWDPGGCQSAPVAPYNASGSITYRNQPLGSTYRNSTYESFVNVTTTIANNTWLNWTVTNMVALEYSTTGKNITFQLIVDVESGALSSTECIRFNSSEAAVGKPYLNVTYTEGGGGGCNPFFNVTWNGPQNNTWNESTGIMHYYTPIWNCNTLANCTLWTNISGTFQSGSSNATPLVNNSINEILFGYGSDTNLAFSYINCTNTTGTSNYTGNYTIKIDTTPPTAPTVTFVSSGEDWINVTLGSCSDAGIGVNITLLYRNGTNIVNFSGGGGWKHNDTGLASCTNYSYIAGCMDNMMLYGDNSSALSVTTNHTTPPDIPTGLANTSISDNCVDLAWDGCNTTMYCLVDTYRIFRHDVLAGTNTTPFFHECGLDNCTTYKYNIDVNDTGGARSSNSSDFLYLTTGCAAPPDTSAPNVTLISPVNNTNSTSASNIFSCNATAASTLSNATLWSNFTGTWQANETKSASGTSDSESFTKALTNGSYIWNCRWCITANNCSFASANWTINISITPATGTGTGFIFIQIGGGDSTMIGVIVIALMSALFAYFSINQKAKEWKLAFFLLSIMMMYVTLVLAIEELPLTNQTITSAVYDSGTSTYNFTYSNVTDTTPQVNTLAAMLSPMTWLIYLILVFTAIELLVNLIQFIRKGWV